MFFSQDWRERIKTENPDAGFGEVGKLLGAKWKELDDEEKKVRLHVSNNRVGANALDSSLTLIWHLQTRRELNRRRQPMRYVSPTQHISNLHAHSLVRRQGKTTGSGEGEADEASE